MRVLLFTGKGGVGKTTAAAATAAATAAAGHKTLVVSTDRAHSLADALGSPLGPQPVEVDAGLLAVQLDAQRDFERTWRTVQDYLHGVLERAGVDSLAAEELTVLPGAEEVLCLLAVRDLAASDRFDVVCVDCAPTAETLRLLALPDALQWYVERIFPLQRRVVRHLRPLLNRSAASTLPQDRVFEAVLRLHGELADCRRLLTDPSSTSIRLVLTPEAVVIAEARRTLTALSLHGYRVDAAVVNRVFPHGGGDWQTGWADAQAASLADVRASFEPLPVYVAPYLPVEPIGVRALQGWAQAAYGGDPLATPPTGDPLRVDRTTDGYALVVSLPFAEREQVELVRAGDDVVVTVDGYRRVIALPSALRRCQVVDARVREGALRVAFEPDPAQWMQS